MPARSPFPLADLPDAAMVLSGNMVVALNRSAAQMLQLSPGVEPVELSSFIADTAELERWLLEPGEVEILRIRVDARRSDGVPFAADLTARRNTRDEVLCLLREVAHDRIAGEAQLYFDIAFETAPIGMALFNTDGQYTRVNDSLCRMLGRERDELLGRRDQEFTHPDDRQSDVDAAWRILRGEIDTWQCEKRFVRPNGSILWTIANLTFLRDEDEHPLSWVGQFQDITERKRREAKLRRLADRDPLTGLLNRRSFERRLEEMIDAAEAGAVLLIDLDQFKAVNDSHGHRVGDGVLTAVAGALTDSLRAADIVARVGGDEFAAILPGAGTEAADALALVLADAVADLDFDFGSDPPVRASIGFSLINPQLGPTLDTVLIEADAAMYRIKHERKPRDREPRPPSRRSDWGNAREALAKGPPAARETRD